MDYTIPSQISKDHVHDLESGVTDIEELENADPVSGMKEAFSFFNKVYFGLATFDTSPNANGESCLVLKNTKENVKFSVQKNLRGEDVANSPEKKKKERRKSTSGKRPPKPPRPPKGLSLDAADEILIKEIAELAMMKRARIERMKELKKMKAVKASSWSNTTLLAALFTLFCLVIVFLGMPSYSSSSVSFSRSPEPTRAADRSGNLIFVQKL